MLVIFFGPSCSGKSSVAEIVAERTGASVWTGKDYLRLAKNPSVAWTEFVSLLTAAARQPELEKDSVIYVVTGIPEIRIDVPEPVYLKRIRFTADIETLKSRFAPRTGGHVPPPVAAMLERTKAAVESEPADRVFDTGDADAGDIADAILSDL
ncbi:MAG TPA: hypothetical protein PLV45_02210 [bacterium]|nr:hypothetical protein [bacterium]